MAKNQCDDAIQISPRCLGIVFKERKQKRAADTTNFVDNEAASSNVDCQSKSKARQQQRRCGEELFREFISENECCYWNPHLQESIKHLKFEGHFHPYTILVTGRDIYLDTVKAAWSQRTIRSPKGFVVHRVGEVSNISMVPIAQSQFTPLPEALCITISDLTKNNEDASFDAIMDQLKNTYRGLQQPTEQITYQTLASLIKERKIYHTGRGYHILSPDLYQPGSNNITVKEHHLVIGGTDTANGITPMLYIPLVQHANHTDMRSISCQTEVKGSDTESQSKTDKNDLIPKKDDKSPSGKESKRNKKDGFVRSASLRYSEEKCKNLVKDVNLKTSDINQDKDKGEKSSLFSKLFGRSKIKDSGSLKEEDKPEMVEYATFSAQFPPQEWGWYEAQVERQVQAQAASPLIHPTGLWHDSLLSSHLEPLNDNSTEAVYHEIHNHSADCPMAQSYAMPVSLMPKSSSHSGSWPSLNEIPSRHDHPHTSNSKQHHRQNKADCKQPKAFNKQHHSPPDARQKEQLTNSQHSPSEYRDLRHCRNTFDSPQVLNNAVPVSSPDRPSHVTKVFRKYREMKCTTLCTNDISIEYCGRMPRRESQIARSRDSGVNCIGQMMTHNTQPQMFSSCHYNADVTPLNNYTQVLKDGTSPESLSYHSGALPSNSLPPGYNHNSMDHAALIHADGSPPALDGHPGEISCEDMYPPQELRNEGCDVGTGVVQYNLDQHNSCHHSSETSIWSDNSRQTVMEVKQPTRPTRGERKDSPLSWPNPERGLPHEKDSYPGDEYRSKYYHRHNRSRSKSPIKSVKESSSERCAKPKNNSKHAVTNGKTLANHVYESHQRIATRQQLTAQKTSNVTRH